MLGWTQLIVNKNEVFYVYSGKAKATQGDTRECRLTGTQGRHTPPSNNFTIYTSHSHRAKEGLPSPFPCSSPTSPHTTLY